MRTGTSHSLVTMFDDPVTWRNQPGKHPQQRALAAAAASEQGYNFASMNGHADILEHREGALAFRQGKGLGQVFRHDERRLRSHVHSHRPSSCGMAMSLAYTSSLPGDRAATRRSGSDQRQTHT